MTQPSLFAEKARLHAASMRVLAHLEQHGAAYNYELAVPEIGGIRAVGRVWELQQMGYPIRKDHIKGGIYRYTLEAR